MEATIRSGKHFAENVNLTGSRFHDVSLKSAAFDDVNLSDAFFHNVNLAGTRFDDINMSHVAITHACYEGMTIDGILVTDLLKTYREHVPPAK